MQLLTALCPFVLHNQKGSMCIIFFIIAQPTPKKRWSMFHQLMFGISVFDSLSSLGFILGTLPAPENTALYNARGTEATCSFQGWSTQLCIVDHCSETLKITHMTAHYSAQPLEFNRMDASGWTSFHVLQRGVVNVLLAGH
jgi:hypothetical protein